MNKYGKYPLIAMVALAAALVSAEPYNNLFRIMLPKGDCRVMLPSSNEYVEAIKGKAYPFGTKVKCGQDSSAIILFTENDMVRMMADTDATITLSNGFSRVVGLEKGLVVTRIGANTTNGLVTISTPMGICSSIAGNCKVKLDEIPATKTEPATRRVELCAEAVSHMKFVSDHYIIPSIKNGFGAMVSSTLDGYYTTITDLLGDYTIFVNTGLDPDPAGVLEENQELQAIKMSAKSVLKLWRVFAPIGGRPIVSVFVTNPSGKGRESFAYAAGQSHLAASSDIFYEGVTNDIEEIPAPAGNDHASGNGQADAEEGEPMDFLEESAPAAEAGAPAAEPVSDDEGLYDFLY